MTRTPPLSSAIDVVAGVCIDSTPSGNLRRRTSARFSPVRSVDRRSVATWASRCRGAWGAGRCAFALQAPRPASVLDRCTTALCGSASGWSKVAVRRAVSSYERRARSVTQDDDVVTDTPQGLNAGRPTRQQRGVAYTHATAPTRYRIN